MSYSKELVKENLELEDIYNLLEYFNAEPQMYNTYIVAKTICHHGDSYKLYYYENTQLFKCYTGECGTFDVFELVQKYEEIDDLNKAIYFVVNFFNLQSKIQEENEEYFSLEDWKIFSRYEKLKDIAPQKIEKVCLPEYPNFIKNYPRPVFLIWEKEGITKPICDYMNICYDPINGAILIPHYDEDDRLVGIRQRTLIQELEIYGKYRPAKIQNQLCNHPLAFNLYGLNKAKENIQEMKIAIVLEAEKSVLQFLSYFGTKSNIAVAVCGSSLSKYQFELLKKLGVEEICIGFDKDFHPENLEERTQVENKLLKIHEKYGKDINLSFLFDNYDILSYKASPLDCGKEAFELLWRNRVVL